MKAKIMIVDDLWVSVGSANIDSRSFRLNDEANLNVLAAGFAAAVRETGQVEPGIIAGWSAIKRTDVIVGHTDTLALPPKG
jgi:phosphatidylserine/phosphatidylglycerophosphate/cardiolipin synthase-like enzyme